jgi:hypothetical protein
MKKPRKNPQSLTQSILATKGLRVAQWVRDALAEVPEPVAAEPPAEPRRAGKRRPREASVQKSIVEMLEQRGFLVKKMHGSIFSRGWPDLMAMRDGRILWIEVKRPGEVPSDLQRHMLDKLRKHGQIAVWTDNLAGALEAVELFDSFKLVRVKGH